MNNPLTPKDCDLRDFQFMPLDVRRLLTSETWVTGNDAECKAAMTLWLESWHQVPAASLPNNDKMLAHLSGAGAKWAKVKAHVLRGWIDGGDGRLYHAVVAEKALEAWIEKLSAAIAGNIGNAKRWQIDIDNSQLQSSLREAVEQLKVIAPRSKTLSKKTAKLVEAQSLPVSPPDSPSDRNRQGQGQGQGQGNIYNNNSASAIFKISLEWCPQDGELFEQLDKHEIPRGRHTAKTLTAFVDRAAARGESHTHQEWILIYAKWLQRERDPVPKDTNQSQSTKKTSERHVVGVPISRINTEARPGETEEDCAKRLKNQGTKTEKPSPVVKLADDRPAYEIYAEKNALKGKENLAVKSG